MTLTELAQPTLRSAILSASASTDGTGTFIDTGTVRALARDAEFLGDRGRELTLRSPAVRVLTLLGLSDLIEGTTSGPHHGVRMTRKKEAPWASS